MSAGLMLLIALTLTFASGALLFVYVIRVVLRIVALRLAVRFLAIPGTNGSSTDLARQLFAYLTTGKVRN